MLAEFFAGRGARRMDREDSRWVWRTDRRRLNIADGSRCVLGQNYGSYDLGRQFLGIGNVRAASYGFFSIPILRVTWVKLNMAWLDEIDARRQTRERQDLAA